MNEVLQRTLLVGFLHIYGSNRNNIARLLINYLLYESVSYTHPLSIDN